MLLLPTQKFLDLLQKKLRCLFQYFYFPFFVSYLIKYHCFLTSVGRSSTMLDEISSNAGNFATKNPHRFNYRHTNGTTRHVLNPKQSQLNQTTDQIKRGYKVLVILRGLPGSGKSYLARKIVEISVGSHDYHNFIFSADDYFMRRGTYQYDPTKIQEAHTFNQQRAFGAMKNGVSPVIIDNTNTQMWEIKPYAMVASKYAYIIEILEPCTPWAFNEKELSRRNTHGVPRVKLKEMLMRYERGVTPEKVFRAFGIRYENLMPPQLRLYPSLMEEKPKCFEEKQAKKVEVKKEEQKPSVDEMLSICKNDNAIVLKPKVCSTTIPEADLSLWGVSESALHSWDVCTPITTKQAEKLEQVTINETATASSAIQTVEAATNTSSNDFLLAANPESDVKILITNCRDINQHSFYEIPPLPRKKIVVDKSSMVGEDLMEQRLEKKDAIQQLKTVFPSIPHIYLREIYDKCKGDLDWAIDLLCDDSLHKLVSPQENLQEEEEEEQNQDDETSEKDQFVELNASALIDNTTTSTVTDDAEKEELKRILEERVVIGDDFYSEHILKLKSKNSYDPTSQPSTSKVHKISTDAGNVIAVDSDVDMDDFDLETASESTSNGSDSQEMMELNLGEAFVTELESKLQESTLQYPKGFLPIVQVPVALARQLYALYIESVYQQMDAQNEVLDMLVKEDEEFAKKLQAQEVQSQPRPEPTTIPEIMQEQHELNLCRKEVEQWKNLTPDDFAAKMTMKKLFESFPNIARDVLVEIWQAHGNSYKETVESIMASSPNDADIGANVKIDEPPVSEEIFGEMREAYNQVIHVLRI